MATAVFRVVMALAPYLIKAAEVKKAPTPDAGEQVKEKSRWLQGTVRNASDFPILAQRSHFDSGRYEDGPSRIDAFELATFSACNGDNTFMTGVSGGQSFKIEIDEQHAFAFSIGFTNPWAGTYKASVVTGDDPHRAYDHASQEGGSIESETYVAKDADGKEVRFKLHVSATAGQHPHWVVSETRF
ncbi:MAG: hypothetical protein M1826_001866 [Phylliscum demangeonii]|nr:MAG: hypothetical protein M1826_001866 [Phylliscum demangeonii]